MNQVLLGISLPFVLFAAVYAARLFRASLAMLVAAPVTMVLCSLWAVAPDLPRLLGMHALYGRLARDPRCDIFLWHYTIDRIEIDSTWYSGAFIVVMLALLGAAWRELALAEDRP